eukprot:CAMPEP_0184653682 /NCGR_PEP_ID=MMETSP0308-20130426/11408_1 /TAXON_ID=38269 /ORGANISM="Gloeochaete witrockiana, Strain SAG 46.84" /LENGTH=160 /DNA_ID=CAMNT_0027089283 /DNA_START=72 /DNA_END=551 /DNA_ORIENTATION=-
MKIRLTYLDGRGRAEAIRLILNECDLEFEDKRITRDEYVQMKRTGLLPFGQLPIIDFDGFQLVQSKAIIRYIARLKGLYGCDAKEGALCDMISEALTDVNVLASAWFYSTEDKRPVVEANYESVLPSWLAYFENLLKTSHHKSYFVGDRLTYADILVFDW